MLFSLITVCFNSEKTIRKTLDSVYYQSYQDFEYIIVDGGSSDGTLDIIREYQEKFNGKMSFVSESDNGIYDAMNKGIRMAKGTLIGIINSDDWYERDTLALVNEHYTGGEYEVIYGMQKSWENGIPKITFIKNHDFIATQMLPHPTCFVTKKTYEKFGVFDLNYKSSADYEFMIRLVESKRVIFIPIYFILANFTMGGMSSGQTGVRENAHIRYKYGYISGRKKIFTILKSHIYELLKSKK